MQEEITSIEQVGRLVAQGFTEWGRYGDVASSERDQFVLLCYTRQAILAGRWNWFERNARGLLFDAITGCLAARPFEKFFNYGEGGRFPAGRPVSICQKIDGSLGILYQHLPGDWRITTKGSLYSEQGAWATEWFRRNCRPRAIPRATTLLFEIVYPENRIVVNYGDYEGLYLIGARDIATGEYMEREQLSRLATLLGDSVRFPLLHSASIQQVLAEMSQLPANEEGFVAEFENGERFKFKGAAYLAAHRMLSGLTFGRVLEMHQQGDLPALRAILPEELWETVDDWVEQIEGKIAATTARVTAEYNEAMAAINGNLSAREQRKAFAEWVRSYAAGDDAYLFAMYGDKSILPAIYRREFQRKEE